MTKGGFYNTIPLRDQLKKTMIGYDKKPLLSTVSVCILSVQPTSKKKGDYEMAEFQADQERSLFDDSYIVREQVKVRAPSRPRFKTIPYNPSSKMYRMVQAIAHSKGWSIPQTLKELGYSSSSVNSTWLKKGECPKSMEFISKGWLALNKLTVIKDQQGVYQVIKEDRTGPVQVRYEKVPVPLTTQNVLDLIAVCANNGEEQLILPLAKLLGDKVVLTD
tara:strand:- start:82 stop:738 length:657 start_codon:yes stop_codon:yes gene_type:complete